jgi:hypothetical protein
VAVAGAAAQAEHAKQAEADEAEANEEQHEGGVDQQLEAAGGAGLGTGARAAASLVDGRVLLVELGRLERRQAVAGADGVLQLEFVGARLGEGAFDLVAAGGGRLGAQERLPDVALLGVHLAPRLQVVAELEVRPPRRVKGGGPAARARHRRLGGAA